LKRRSAALLFAVLLTSGSLLAGCRGTFPEVETSQVTEESSQAPESLLAEGVVPVTWEPSADHLIIESDEARELYTRIKAGDYPTLEELQASPIIGQIDSLSAYYIAVYGKTHEINTPEREQLREDILKEFLSAGSARVSATDPDTGWNSYAYDGPLEKGFQMELVLGLPAAGKSTRVTDPDSLEQKAFILDCDIIKEMIPEFKESHGCGADAVHMESMGIMDKAVKAFTEGEMKGTNVILPLVADSFDSLMENYIKPFEDAGYNVRAKFVPCEVNVSMARNIARELETGRIINSKVVFSFGTKPEEVYNKLAPMINAKGVAYGYEE